MVNVRVRGIYATAISKILLDSGFKLVEASEKIRERLGVEFSTGPCDVTVKNTENPDELLVIGFPREAESVYNVLVNKLNYVYAWKSPLELHAVYLGVISARHGDLCVVDLGGFQGTLLPCREEKGTRVVVGVKAPPLKPGERLQLTKNFRIVGKYVMLVHGDPRISFSEHVRDSSIKASLSAVAASKLMGSGLGVHFRSSSKYAAKETIAQEIENLLAEYRALMKLAGEVESPAKLRSGEFIGLLGLTSLAKRELDEYRRQVECTIDMHHSLKASGLSDLVDFAEYIISCACASRGENTASGVAKYIAKGLEESSKVEFIHVKPTGEVIRLNPGRVVKVSVESNRVVLVAERVMRSQGVYDGLGVEKRPGDLDYVVVDTGKPVISHNYYREGVWLGSYININTPPEVVPGIVKYHDLLVDVVVYPSGEVKVVDLEDLEKLREQGVVMGALYNYARNALNNVLSNPLNYVYNPRGIRK